MNIRRRYVEISYQADGDDRWFGGFTEAYSPKEAVTEAETALRQQRPDVTEADIDVLLVREVDAEKERSIRDQIAAGTWTGW